MKIVMDSENQFVLRFQKGDDFSAELKNFVKRRKIKGGFFYGLGAFTDPVLAYYDLNPPAGGEKKYLEKKFAGDFEIAGMTGNSAWLGKEAIIHCHVVLGDRNYRAFAGHLVSAKVAGTLEVHLFKFDNKMERSLDKETGLRLLK